MSCRESQFFVIPFWNHIQIYSWIYVIPLLGHVRSCSNSHWDPRHKLCRVPFFPIIFQAAKWFEMLHFFRSDTMEILACFGEVSVTVESHVTPLRIGGCWRMVWGRSWACKVAVFERQLISIGRDPFLKNVYDSRRKGSIEKTLAHDSEPIEVAGSMLKIDWNILFCSTSISPVPGARNTEVNQCQPALKNNGKNDCLASIWQQWQEHVPFVNLFPVRNKYMPNLIATPPKITAGWNSKKNHLFFFEKEHHYVQIYRKTSTNHVSKYTGLVPLDLTWWLGDLFQRWTPRRNWITLPKTNLCLFPWKNGWWFHLTWGKWSPFWRIFFRWVGSTTN